MQKDPAALTVTRRDLQHNLPAGTDDDLRRPDLDEEAVRLVRLEEGDVLGFVLSVREPFPVTRGGLIDGAEGSTEPAWRGKGREFD